MTVCHLQPAKAASNIHYSSSEKSTTDERLFSEASLSGFELEGVGRVVLARNMEGEQLTKMKLLRILGKEETRWL